MKGSTAASRHAFSTDVIRIVYKNFGYKVARHGAIRQEKAESGELMRENIISGALDSGPHQLTKPYW